MSHPSKILVFSSNQENLLRGLKQFIEVDFLFASDAAVSGIFDGNYYLLALCFESEFETYRSLIDRILSDNRFVDLSFLVVRQDGDKNNIENLLRNEKTHSEKILSRLITIR